MTNYPSLPRGPELEVLQLGKSQVNGDKLVTLSLPYEPLLSVVAKDPFQLMQVTLCHSEGLWA